MPPAPQGRSRSATFGTSSVSALWWPGEVGERESSPACYITPVSSPRLYIAWSSATSSTTTMNVSQPARQTVIKTTVISFSIIQPLLLNEYEFYSVASPTLCISLCIKATPSLLSSEFRALFGGKDQGQPTTQNIWHYFQFVTQHQSLITDCSLSSPQ